MFHFYFLQGKIEAEGTYSQLQQSGLDFAKLLGREDENERNKNSESMETLCFTSQHSIEVILKFSLVILVIFYVSLTFYIEMQILK